MAENGIVEVADRAVSYAVEGEGPVSLVLIPERGLDADALGVVSHYLAQEAGFRVVRVGVSALQAGAGAVNERVGDVVAVMDHLGLGRAWIGGHGSGGTVAREVAAAHTDRVNGLLLLGVEDEPLPLPPAIPVLIIQASDDDITPPSNAERLQSAASDRASIKRIEGADHLFPLTRPVETAVAIEEYLDWD